MAQRAGLSGWLDRAIGTLSPETQLRRVKARAALEIVARHYEGASTGRRTQGWKRPTSDPNAATAPYARALRDVARDLVRNNPYAKSGLRKIVNHTVGWGIYAKSRPRNRALERVWRAWAGTTKCDADGRHDFAGLQKLVMRTVVQSGEALVRRRIRRPEDGLPLPLQIQVLEPDFIDTNKHGITLPNGGRIVYGVEFDGIGRRVAYWLYPEHPGNSAWPAATSQRVPAAGIAHVYECDRAGQSRGVSMYGPAIPKLKDFDEYEDATLVKQKVAACLAVVTTDVDGTSPALGTADDTQSPATDSLEPGMVLNLPPGRSVNVVQPPSVAEYGDYSKTTLRAIAAGIGTTYEDLTGDYTNLPFSAARMSRVEHWQQVDDWRWMMLIPQFCAPVWEWAMETAVVMGLTEVIPEADWAVQPMPALEPDKEGLGVQRNIRTGIQTLSGALRELGLDPEDHLREMAADNALLDELGLVLDSDPRQMTQAGQAQSSLSGDDSDEDDEAAKEEDTPDEDAETSEQARAIVRRFMVARGRR